MVESAGAPVPVNATEARKRRKAIITQHRSDEPPASSSAVYSATSPSSTLPSSDVADQVLRDANNAPAESVEEDTRSKEGSKRDENVVSASTSHVQGSKADAENEHGEESDRRRRSDGGDEWDNDGDGSESHDVGIDGSDDRDGRENSKKRGQIRYDPDVPMSKEQLAMWRRECRRVRNRESAAASRARVRNRIQELEVEVEDWKTKYAQAVQRLEHLQQIQSSATAGNGSA